MRVFLSTLLHNLRSRLSTSMTPQYRASYVVELGKVPHFLNTSNIGDWRFGRQPSFVSSNTRVRLWKPSHLINNMGERKLQKTCGLQVCVYRMKIIISPSLYPLHITFQLALYIANIFTMFYFLPMPFLRSQGFYKFGVIPNQTDLCIKRR
jgi:hypothetical protein